MYYIYEIKNLINGKTYIGQRRCPKDKTPEIDDYMGSGELVIKAIKKYGLENFIKSILEEGIETKKEADNREIYWIDVGKKEGKCQYNISRGGTGGNLGEEVIKKIGEKQKICWSNLEYKERLRKKHLGISPSNKGIPMSDEQKEKDRLSHLGKKHTEEWSKKHSEFMKEYWKNGLMKRKSLKGISLSEEHKKKISESRMGKNKGIKAYNLGMH